MGVALLKSLKIKFDLQLLFLGLIVVVFLASRLVFISKIPPSVYWDEASIGYNAFSISQDLKDEWGELLPLHFRAFGEFKLPVYIYTTAVFVKLFGLNAASVRLGAVFYSLITVLLTYLIAKKIFASKAKAVMAAFLLAISPWFFIFSRTGYEISAGLAFFLGAIYFLLDSKRSGVKFALGVAFLIASMYSYNSFRIISPIVFLLFCFIKVRSGLKKNLAILFLSLVIFFVSLIPIARLFIYDAGFGRAQGFSLIPSIQQVYDLAGNPHLQVIYDRNADINWGENFTKVISNYLSHFSPSFLLHGDANPRSQLPGFGQVYLPDIFLFVLGIFYMLKKKKPSYYFVIFLFLIGFLPVAFFKEAPHALRSLASVPPVMLIITSGIIFLTRALSKYKTLILIGIVVVYGVAFENYYKSFLENYSRQTSADWQYGYSQIYSEFGSDIEKYNHVVITDEYAQPYIFALYYLAYDPAEFRTEKQLSPVDNWGFSTVSSFGKFEFRKPRASDFNSGNLLFVTAEERPGNIKPDGVIKNLDGSESLIVYKL